MAQKRDVVAVVDDDPAIRKAMETLLSSLGYCAELFASGQAFREAATNSKARCLLVDIQLGDISGIELTRKLLDDGFTFPIIFMTALDDERVKERAAALGCAAYLCKPFSANELVDAMIRAAAIDTPNKHRDTDRQRLSSGAHYNSIC
jgi:FixJ family two-component response regulator